MNPRHRLRIAVLLIGLILPYLARVLGGWDYIAQYGGYNRTLLIQTFNLVPLGLLLIISFTYRDLRHWLLPVGLGFGFLIAQHATLDFSGADPFAAIALALVPMWSVVPIVLGAIVSWTWEWHLRRALRRGS